jgi:hypothetical protein
MSGTIAPAVNHAPIDDTRVPADIQQRLRDYWNTYGPNAGAIVPTTAWDRGGTVWDNGATIWPS